MPKLGEALRRAPREIQKQCYKQLRFAEYLCQDDPTEVAETRAMIAELEELTGFTQAERVLLERELRAELDRIPQTLSSLVQTRH